MTDYAFVGNDDDEITGYWRGLFSARPQKTTQIPPGTDKVANLRDFITSLSLSPLVSIPIGNLLVASHAASNGWLELSIDGKSAESITFELLLRANKTILIPPGLLPQSPDGGIIPVYFHVRGCDIGKSSDFVTLLQSALGGHINVTAPLHPAGVGPWDSTSHPRRGNTPGAYFEYMTYEFSQFYLDNADQSLPNRKQLIKAFQSNPAHTLIDATAVPQTAWDSWIPKSLPKKTDTGDKKFPYTITFDPAWGVQPNGGDLRNGRIFRFNTDQPIMRNASGGPAANSSAATRRDFMKQILGKEASFQATYRGNTGLPPVYERYGFATLDDFMNAYDWVLVADLWVSRRYEYACLVPITKPTTNQLICNFYSTAVGGAFVGMPETNARMFLTKLAS